ncbi:hypothetical protein CICLE_v10003693mg [Citrus x clementina]|uniref:Uncharacterized protein n=1 Tax=Citrus clementina TaxID=85681 RepID=V4UZF0_CITCL|nr:hypothetical protein CICLE_v10003693mg [Citrus x clementina]
MPHTWRSSKFLRDSSLHPLRPSTPSPPLTWNSSNVRRLSNLAIPAGMCPKESVLSFSKCFMFINFPIP